ncbi:hypothetical protein D3C73_1132290 [compost metagenome]
MFFVDVLAFQKLVAGELESLRIRGVIADENTGEIVEDERLAAIDSFTPNTEEYYRLLFSRL